MRVSKRFDEFVKEGVVRKHGSDLIRAKDVLDETERNMAFLNNLKQKVPLNEENANNYLELSYNIILGKIRVKMLIEGYKASGFSAHEAEVSYMVNLGFSEADVEFMNELRYSRNGMLYYGKKFEKDYAEKVLTFLDKIYSKLNNLLKDKYVN